MQIIWFDSFDHYYNTTGDAAILDEGIWASVNGTITNAVARTGLHSLNLGELGHARRSLGGDFEYCGTTFAFYMDSLPVRRGPFILSNFRDGDNFGHVGVHVSTTGRLTIERNNYDFYPTTHSDPVILATSSREIAPGTWNHIEVKARIHATDGYVKVRVNGRDFVSVSGVKTRGDDTTGAMAAQVGWGTFTPGSPDFSADLLCIDDPVTIGWADDGSEDTTFLGQYGVYYLKPNADTAVAQWSLTTGINGYALINETQPDDDVNYIFATASGKKSAFAVEALPLNITSVAAVATMARMRKTDSGAVEVKLGVISAGTEDEQADPNALTTSYSWYFNVWEEDPHTSSAWLPTVLPAIQVDRST